MSKLLNFPSISDDAEDMLHNILKDHAGDIEHMVIVITPKEGEDELIYSSTPDKGVLSIAAAHLISIASSAAAGSLSPV